MSFLSYAPNGLSATPNAAIPMRETPATVRCAFRATISRPGTPGSVTMAGEPGAAVTPSAGTSGTVSPVTTWGCATGFWAIATFCSSTIFNPSGVTSFGCSGAFGWGVDAGLDSGVACATFDVGLGALGAVLGEPGCRIRGADAPDGVGT